MRLPEQYDRALCKVTMRHTSNMLHRRSHINLILRKKHDGLNFQLDF